MKKEDESMVKICCDFILMNWADVSVLQIKKLFRMSLTELKLSTYRHDAIITILTKRYLTDEQKTANDVKKIPKIIKELERTMSSMTEEAQEELKKQLHATFKTKEQIQIYQEIEDALEFPPLKKQRLEDDHNDNCLDISMCSLFDL